MQAGAAHAEAARLQQTEELLVHSVAERVVGKCAPEAEREVVGVDELVENVQRAVGRRVGLGHQDGVVRDDGREVAVAHLANLRLVVPLCTRPAVLPVHHVTPRRARAAAARGEGGGARSSVMAVMWWFCSRRRK